MRMIAAVALCLFSLPLFAATPEDDAAVRAVAQKYFEAHATGQAAPLVEAFHPEWRMLWVKDGALMKRTRDEYTSGFTGKASTDEDRKKRTIEHVDITGNAAVVKLRLDYPKSVITDYMVLLKVEGKWQVVAKAFDVAPK